MSYRTIVLQTISFLVVLSFAPGCDGGLLDFLPFGSWFQKYDKSARSIAYEKDIQAQIEMFKDVLVEPKCSPLNLVDGNNTYMSCAKFVSYCDRDWFFDMCPSTCCMEASYVNSTKAMSTQKTGCARPCEGHSYCYKTTDPERPDLSHCEENSFTAVNLRPVITEMELDELLSLPVIGE